ncbi:hypothetical protein H7U35_13460 [Mediterranea massiliensis]|uniref:Glycosyltransferase subfamily 4-like N-terminal domain-containing protein n=1 Tax=Mediterranea massiliensis TaxID=1841865 RepID=A0ABS2E3M9_9BACT|nr:glycosyltransferase [Mediterranea massiliensis]MBM6736208.1 hypothetical protein [Mediterranea massiliensis]
MSKILFCDNNLYDLLNFRGDVIENYVTNGYKVVLVAPKTMELPDNWKGIKYIPVKLNRSAMNPLSELKYLCRLIKIYYKERPDYIFHYTIKPNIYGTLAAKFCGIPSTAMIAGLGYVFDHKGIGCFIARGLYRFALRFSQKVLVLNSYNRDLVLEKRIAAPEQVILLPGGEGINLEKYK